MALGTATLLLVSVAVVAPAAAEAPGGAAPAPDSPNTAREPSPNPDSPLNVISLAVSEGTEVSWEAPRPTDLAPKPTGYSVRTCGPFEIGSDELTKASAAMCAGEKSLVEVSIPAEPGGSTTGASAASRVDGSPAEIRSDGSYKFVSRCAPTATSFCVVALAAVADTGLSKPVVVGSGGIAPEAPIGLKAITGPDGATLELEWVAAPDVVQADDLPSLAQTFEVWRDNVLLARGLTTPEYADESCGLARRCRERVYAVSPAGRSEAVEIDAFTAGTSAPTMIVPDGLLNPGVSVISGSLGNGAEDERPVVVSFVPVGVLADGTTSTVPPTTARSGVDGWTLEIPAALVPGRYVVKATQGTFGSSAVEVPVAPLKSLDIVLGSGPSSSVPVVAAGSLTIGGTATPSPPASQVSIRDSWGAPGGSDSQRSQAELSEAFATTRAASKSTAQNVEVDALGRWTFAIGGRSGLGERHVVEVTQTVPGLGASTRYVEFQMSGGVVVPRTGGSSPLLVPRASLAPAATVPAAPTGLTATAGDRSVSIAFTPGAAGTSPITNYSYQIGSGAWTALNPVNAASPVRITGLANGTAVSIKLRATSLAGQGAISTAVSATPRTIPSTPTGLSAVAGNASATVSFTPGANGGSTITNYEYQVGTGPWVAPLPAVKASPLVISGLTNGTASSIKIRAITAAGPSLPSLAVSVTPRTVPSAPTGLVATAGNLSASIAFTAGADGGSAITNYEYQVGTGAWTALNPIDAASPVTVPGLPNGTQQSIKLRAVNVAGQGAESTVVLVTPRMLSAAPTSLTAVAGDGSASITFVPGSAGTSAITNYQYQIGTGAWTALDPADAASPVVISGLTNGTAYSIKLRPVSVFGAGAASAAVPVTPRVLPSAPTSLIATPGNASAKIAFTPGAAGTGSITNYEYQVGSGAWTAINPADALSPVTVTGLVNGTAASIKLRAVSAYGAGTASTAVSVTPRILPSAPTSLVATPSDRSASITFVAGASGTSAITNYQYQIGSGEWTAFSPAQIGTKLTITGLFNGTSYSIKLRAVGTYGVGAESLAVSVTPRTIPSPPQYTYGVPGDRSIEINFSAGNANGSPITNYEYQIGTGAWVASVPARTSSPLTVTGLANGTLYSIRLRAVTAAGPSLPSSAVTATPRVLPGAPTGLTATARNGLVSIAFTAGSAGTAATTNYEYQLDSGSWTSFFPAITSSPVVVADLTNGTAYSIKIRAVGVLGVGAASAAVVATPRTTPSAPTGLVATPGDRSVSIAFNAGSDGGSAITNYKYQLNNGAWTAFSPADASSPVTITGLVNGTSYPVKLLAVNAAGDGVASAEAMVLSGGVPGAPSNVTVVSKDGAATLRFTAPPPTGLPITAYTVSTTESSPQSFTCTSLIGPPEPVCTLGDLANGSAYSFTVTARNSAGTSVSSAATQSVVIGAPDAPTDLIATPGDGSVNLTWTAPATPSGMYINSYVVTAVGDPSKGCTASGALPGDSRPPSCGIYGLTNGVEYSFTVKAGAIPVSPSGLAATGPKSASSQAVAPAGLPSAPTPVNAWSANGGAVVSWSTPSSTGGSTITRYQVIARAGPGREIVSTFDQSVRVARITGMEEGLTYSIEVAAVTPGGNGPSATTTSFWSPIASKPLAVSAVPGDSSAIVTWSEPEIIPVPVQSYTIRATNYYNESDVVTMESDEIPATMTGLRNGLSYRFTVVAVNASGTSPSSDPSSIVIPAGAPAAPSVMRVDSAPGTVYVSWERPYENGGAEIESYTVELSAPGRLPATKVVSGSVFNMSTTWSFLTNGITYSVRIATTSSGGTSDFVSAGSTMPRGRPDAPTFSSLTTSNGSATAEFAPPASDGGSPLTSFEVTDGNGRGCSIDPIANPGVFTCIVSGLTNGQSYTFKVYAVNGYGSSVASAEKTGTPMALVPGSPTGVTAAAIAQLPGSDVYFPGMIQVSWVAPLDDGGSPITSYVVTDRWDNARTCTAAANATSCVIFGFTSGYRYTFKVVARNAVGSSPNSAFSTSAIPGGTPYAPEILTVTGGTVPTDIGGTIYQISGATVTVSVPDSQGMPVTGYRMKAVEQASQSVSYFTSSTTSIVATLMFGTGYRFSVQALNAFGYGDWSGYSSVVYRSYPPAAATGVNAVPTDGGATVSFTPPAWNGSEATYTVTINDLTDATTRTIPGVSYTTWVGDLVNGHSYTFAITTTNFAGSGPMSSASAAVVPRLRPNAPSNVASAVGNRSLSVSFDAPAPKDGASVTGYRVFAYDTYTRSTSSVSGVSSPMVIGGLVNGRSYRISVAALNDGVEGPATVETVDVVPAARPDMDQPTPTRWEDGQSTVSIRFVSMNGGTLLKYTLELYEYGTNRLLRTINPPSFPTVVTGLTNGSYYYFKASVTTTGGTSDSLYQSGAAIVPVGAPGSPTMTGVSAGDTTASVSFGGPANDGGSGVTGYTVTATSSTDPSHSRTAVGTGSPITVTGLTNGDTYLFSVKATNAVGAGSSARGGEGPSSSSLPAAPGAPTSVVSSDGDGQAQISWTASSLFYGAAVTSYRATASPGGASCVTTVLENCVIEGLSNYTPYTVTVVASNEGGSSTSTPIEVTPKPVTIATALPSAPRSVNVSPSATALVVTWNMPLDDGGGAIRSFTATATPGGGTCTSQAVTSCAIVGTDRYAVYSVAVTATNSVGTSAAERSGPASRCGFLPVSAIDVDGCDPTEYAATNVRAQAVDGGVKVSWNPRFPATSTATAAPSGAQCSANYWTTPKTSDGLTSCVIPGVFPTTEVFRVSSGRWPPDTSASVSPTWVTLSAPTVTNSTAPVVSGSLSTGASLTVIAAPTSCERPLGCASATAFPAAVVNGSYSVALAGLTDGSYNVFVADPDPLASLALTTPTVLVIDRTAPALRLSAIDGVSSSAHSQTGTVIGVAECTPATSLAISWYAGTVAGGTPYATTNPVRSDTRIGNSCSFTSTLAGLPDGDYVAVAAMVDAAGNAESSSVALIVDTVAPALSVSAPTAASTVPAGMVEVRGLSSTTSGDLAFVTIALTSGSTVLRDFAVVDQGSGFSSMFDLGPGSWSAEISRTDLAGNTTVDLRTFVAVESVESVGIALPRSGDVVSGSTTVLGWALPGATVKLSSGTDDLGTAVADSSGSWSTTISLAPGSTSLAAAVGVSSAVIVITVGSPTPSVRIVEPGIGGLTNGRPLSGTGVPDSNLTISIDGVPATVPVDSSGYWTVSLSGYLDGSHIVEASYGGTSVSSTILIDRVAPNLSILAPTGGRTNKQDVILDSASAGADSAAVLLSYFEGTDTSGVPIHTDATVVVADVATATLPTILADGVWTIVATRQDAAGNVGSAQSTFVADTSAPVFTSNLRPSMAGPLVISGTSGAQEGDLPPIISVGDAVWTAPATGEFSFTPTPALTSGVHTVTVSQSDTGGNVQRTTIDVVIDSEAPNLTLASISVSRNDIGYLLRGSATGGDGPVSLLATPDQADRYSTLSGTFDPDGSGNFEARADMGEGWWTIRLERSDAVGNIAVVERRHLVVETVPALIVTGPSGSSRSSTQTITGTTSGEVWRNPTVRIVITPVGSSTAVFTSDVPIVDGAFSRSTGSLADGNYALAVTHDDQRFPVTSSSVFTIDSVAPALAFDPTPSDAVRAVCGTAGTAPRDVASVGIVWTDANGIVGGSQSVVPVAGRFCVSPASNGMWTATATQIDGTGSSTASVLALFDAVAPVVSAVPTSPTTDPTVVAPWAGVITGRAGTAAGDAPTVPVSLIIDYLRPYSYPFYCHWTRWPVNNDPCHQIVEAPVAADGTWTIDTRTLAVGDWHLISVTQADSAGNSGTFVAANAISHINELDGSRALVNTYRFSVDRTAAPVPVLSLASNGVAMSVCNPSSPFEYTSVLKIYRGTASGTPVATVPMPTSQICAGTPTLLVRQNRPGLLPALLPNGDYVVVGEASDPVGRTVRSAPLAYRSNWIVPVVTQTIVGATPGSQDIGGSSTPFGGSVVVSGTAAFNEVDQQFVKLRITQDSGDVSYRSAVTAASEMFATEVPIQADGTWSVTLPSTFPAGSFTTNVTQGSGTAPYQKFKVTSSAPTVDSAVMRTTQLANGSTLKTLLISGSAPTDRTLDSTSVSFCGTVTVVAGRWNCSVSGDFADGSRKFTVTSKTAVSYSLAGAVPIRENGNIVRYDISYSFANSLQSATGEFTTTLSGSAPRPTISTPTPTSTTPSTASVTVAGSAASGNGALAPVTINIYSGSSRFGTPARTEIVAASGTPLVYSKAFTLTEGTWTIESVQSDSSGNIGRSDPVTIIVDTTAPELAVGFPSTDVRMPIAMVSGSIAGSASASVAYYSGSAISGTPFRTNQIIGSSGGGWVDYPALGAGTWTALATATDRAGNATSTSIRFIVDPSAAAPFVPVVSGSVGNAPYGRLTGLAGTPSTESGPKAFYITVSNPNSADRSPVPSGGTARVYNGEVLLGSGTVVNGSAVVLGTLGAAGLVQIRVEYSGDSFHRQGLLAAVGLTVTAAAPATVSLVPRFGSGAGLPGAFDVVLARPVVTSSIVRGEPFVENRSCSRPGRITIVDSLGKTLVSDDLVSTRVYDRAIGRSEYPNQFGDYPLIWAPSAFSEPALSTVAGPQYVTISNSGGADCGPSSTRVLIDIPASSRPNTNVVVDSPPTGTWIPGDHIPIRVSAESFGSLKMPVSLVNAAGTVLAGPINLTEVQICSYRNGIGDCLFNSFIYQTEFDFVPTVVGSQELTVVTGGGTSGYGELRQSVTLDIEPARISPVLSVAAAQPGQDSTVSYVVGAPGLLGSVSVYKPGNEFLTGAPVLRPSLVCAAVCTATSSLPSDLVSGGSDAQVSATFTSSATNRRYTMTTGLNRTLWQPNLVLAAGAGAPIGVSAGSAGSGSVKVSWTAASANSSTITGYTVTAAPGGATCTTTGATSCVVAGLTNGTDYTFSAVTNSTLGTSGANSATATPSATVSAPDRTPVAALAVGSVARDRLVPATATLTFPAGMASSYRTGTLILESVPDANCRGEFDRYSETAKWCFNTRHTVSIDLATGVTTDSLNLNGTARAALSASSLAATGVTVGELTPTSSISWSGNTATVISQVYVGGSGFVLSSSYRPGVATAVATVSTSGVGDIRVTGAGAPTTYLSLASAKITGGYYGPTGVNSGSASPSFTEFSGWDVRAPRVGETAFVRAMLDKTFSTPADTNIPFALAQSVPGAAPYFVQPATLGRHDRLETSSQPTRLNDRWGYGSVDVIYGDADDGQITCSYWCHVWTIRNLDSTTPVPSGGGLSVGATPMGLISYGSSPGTIVAGSAADLAARTSVTTFTLNVDPWDTTQSAEVSFSGTSIDVVTAARWPGMAPEVQTSFSNVMVSVVLNHGGVDSVIGICFYSGICLADDGNGTTFLPTTAVTIGARLGMTLTTESLGFTPTSADTVTVYTSAPWGVTAMSSPLPLNPPVMARSTTGSGSVSIVGQSMGVTLDDQPSLASPVIFPLVGSAIGWQLYDARGALASFGHDFFMYIFGNERVASIFMMLTSVALNMIPAFAYLNAATCGSWRCAAETVGLQTIGLAVKGLTSGISAGVKWFKAKQAAMGVVETQSRIGMFIGKAQTAVRNAAAVPGAKLASYVPMRVKMAMSGEASMLSTLTKSYLTNVGIKVTVGEIKEPAQYILEAALGNTSNVTTKTALPLVRPQLGIGRSAGNDPAFSVQNNITDVIGDGILAVETSSDQVVLDNWQRAIQNAYDKALNGGSTPTTDIGYGPGVGYRLNEFFSSVTSISIPDLASVDLAASTVTVDAMLYPNDLGTEPWRVAGNLGTCDLQGKCTMKSGLSAIVMSGSVMISGVFPQEISWVPAGAWLRVTVKAVPKSGSTIRSYVGRNDIKFPGKKYDCNFALEKMQAQVDRYGYAADTWRPIVITYAADGTPSLDQITYGVLHRQIALCDDIDAMWSHTAPKGTDPVDTRTGVANPLAAASFDPARNYSPHTAMLIGGF